MRKIVSLILICLVVISSNAIAFADTATTGEAVTTTAAASTPTDVKGTKYEQAVTALINKSVITGYEDGTFKPEASITRAEACIIIVKGLATTEGALTAAKESGFTDMTGYGWAKKYINYAAEKEMVNGYGNHIFKPGENVTYNEMAAMLVKALGYKSTDLTGTWPDNYMNKAVELGMLKQVTTSEGFDAGKSATRGSVALMANTVLEKLAKAVQPVKEPPATTTPTNAAINTNTKEEEASKAGKLKNFSGNATGMILGTTKIVNANKETVYEIEFLMGRDTLYVNTDTGCSVPNPIAFDGSVYTLKMENGVIKDISKTGGKLKHFSELTAGWTVVDSRTSRTVTMGTTELTIMKNAIFYKATFSGESISGYKSVGLSEISEGSKIKAYDVTDDSTTNADIVIIVDKTNASNV